MLLVKWIALISIFITSLTIGFAYGDRYAKRVYYLREMMQSIKHLRTEIILLSNPLPIAFRNIMGKSDDKIKSIYENILNDIVSKDIDEVYLSFVEVKEMLRDECFFTLEDIDLFLTLGKTIGKTDRLDQDKHFAYIIEEFNLLIGEAKIERDKNQKMYRSLGILMGLGAVIILI